MARGGRMRFLGEARLALVPLIFASVGLEVAAQFVPASASMAAYVLVIASYAALFAFAGANWRRPGMPFIALGAALNYAVILANQGMPISAAAAARAGWVGESAQQLVIRGKHFIDAGSGARLGILGDVIPLGRAPAVASVGDLVIWAGMILLIQDLVRGPRGRRTGAGRARRHSEPADSVERIVIDVRADEALDTCVATSAAEAETTHVIEVEPGESIRVIEPAHAPPGF